MATKLEKISECELGFVELNPDAPNSIVFLHGALSSPVEASLVTPHLSDYHILMPAMHTNIKAREPAPVFTVTSICAEVAALIRNKAKNGRAHIYGHSMGAHLAVNLAMTNPDVVLTVIASGIPLISHWPWWKRAAIPPLLYGQSILPRVVLSKQRQAQMFNKALQPASEKLVADMLDEPLETSWVLCREVSASLAESLPPDRPVNVRARTLIVAGTAKVADSVADAKWVIDQINKANGDARGVEIKEGGHPWLVQLPVLCADLIRAWIEGKELPKGATEME